jgi:hypothetical protein
MKAPLKPALVSLLALAACSDFLSVPNLVDPGIDQVLGTPAAIEQTIASGFQSCHNSVETSGEGAGALLPQIAALSLEGYAPTANLGISYRVGIPRTPIANGLGAYSIYGDYARLSLGSRLAANALNAHTQLLLRGGTLGSAAQDFRARVFAMLAIGCHQGWLAMSYDSAAIVRPGMARDSVPPLSGAAEVMAAAIAVLDSAVTLAADSITFAVAGAFPLPATWVSGNALTRDQFARLARSLRARFRAGVARTPAERAAVDWTAVIAGAETGIASDFMLAVGGTTGWVPGGNVNATIFYNMAPMYYGMADTSGAYGAWLATPVGNRDYFLVLTPDRRWPAGATRAQQQANSTVPTSFNSRPYVANRATSTDLAGHSWALSYYIFNRLQYIRNTGGSGLFPSITKAEMDLLAAEGYLRKGNLSAAVARIDITRVAKGELPALSGSVTSATDRVPEANRCVPRVPAPPAFTSTICGTVFEALKWEKRMETAYTGYGQWFFDSRGWGDLPENTALELPVPYQELAAREKAYYSLGGGLTSSAVRGTYGF